MSFLHLPNELLFEVTEYLDLGDIYALLQTNHFFAALLAPVLVKIMFSKDTDRHCITALYLAAASGCRERIESIVYHPGLYLTNREDVRQAVIQGSPPLDEVIGFKAGKVIWVDGLEDDIPVAGYVDLFLEGGSSSIIREIWAGMTALHMAADCSNLKMAKLLVEEGINVDEEDFDGDTALHIAAYNESYSMAELLLQGGARVDAQGLENSCPLHIAVADGSRLLLKLFLEYGADISLQDDVGCNALSYAVRAGAQDMVLILLAYSTDIDIHDPDCYLHRVVSRLLNDPNGGTVLDFERLLARYGEEGVVSPVNPYLRDLEGLIM